MCTEFEVRTGLFEPWLTIVTGDCEKEHGLFAFLGGKYTIHRSFMGSKSGSNNITSKVDKVIKESGRSAVQKRSFSHYSPTTGTLCTMLWK